jgi:hypothetical protein
MRNPLALGRRRPGTALLFAALAAALGFSLAPGSATGDAARTPGSDAPSASPAIWEMSWDDAVDASLSLRSKGARLTLTVVRGRVNGAFIGEVAGTTRDAIFTGEAIGSGSTSLVLLQQHEPDYACAYQLQAQGDGRLSGVWHDTRGRSGDVVLRPCGR